MATPLIRMQGATPGASDSVGPLAIEPDGPLRVAVLIKQVPLAEHLDLDRERRLRRDGVPLEMNPFCRRAVAAGVELARVSAGTCTVLTLGPRSAEEVLREAIAWGADRGVHLCDPAFAGSDSLATATSLSAAIRLEGPFDIVLAGRNSVDGETGHVAPQIAELLDLPFAGAVRALALTGRRLRLRLERDDGWEEVEVPLPALLTAAERLCTPCKAGPEERQAVSPGRLETLTAGRLGPGPWGQEGSPTSVGPLRRVSSERAGVVHGGDLPSQVAKAVAMLQERGALGSDPDSEPGRGSWGRSSSTSECGGPPGSVGAPVAPGRPLVTVVVDPEHDAVGAELLGAARALADELGGSVVAWRLADHTGPADQVGRGAGPTSDAELPGAELVVELASSTRARLGAEDVARALSDWARRETPWAVLVPSTGWGREVAARTAASLRAGLVADATGIALSKGELVATKPAFFGAFVVDVSCASPVRMVTVRPGVLPLRRVRGTPVQRTGIAVEVRGRVTTLEGGREDDLEALARACVVIGVGAGVLPHEQELLVPLAELLGAELGATRKVTDRRWAPRARQIGITGRSIAPRLYLALALRGTFNHMVGVRGARTVLAINADPAAPVFSQADVGIVGDWHQAVPLLEAELRAALGAPTRSEPAARESPGAPG